MAPNKDTSPPKPKKKLFARWRRKERDADQEKLLPEAMVDQNSEAALEPEGAQPNQSKAASEDVSTRDDASRSHSQIDGADTAPVQPMQQVEEPDKDDPTELTGVKLAEAVVSEQTTVELDDKDTPALAVEQQGGQAPAVIDELSEASTEEPVEAPTAAPTEKPKRPNVFRRAMSKTGRGLETLFLGRRQIDEQMLEDLETQLLMADVGIEVCTDIIDKLTDRVKRKELSDNLALREALHQIMVEILQPCEQALDVSSGQPCVILVVGINGVGKTTTIGKLARNYQNQGLSVMLAAGDTFRAAAVEQLQAWGDRNDVPVIAQHTGADSASVIYDGIESATARNIDVLIADTAGRLHTKSNLMDELAKVKRVMAKLNEDAPHEVLLVLDAGTGQNALRQVQEFNETVAVTGLAITKLDGTAKGGVVLALCRHYGIPVRYIGVGEGVADLQVFCADDYVQAMLSETSIPETLNDQV